MLTSRVRAGLPAEGTSLAKLRPVPDYPILHGPGRIREIRLFARPTPWLQDVAFTPDGRHVLTVNPDGTMAVLRLAPRGEAYRVPAGGPAAAAPLAVAPFDAAKAKEHQEASAKQLGAEVEITNSIGMKLRLIPPGEFAMAPNYQVAIRKPFRIGMHEVTIGQFRAFVNETGYKTVPEVSGTGTALHNGGLRRKARSSPGGTRTSARETITRWANSAGTTPSSSANG